jgi:exodeoxyribonuclease VII large subunit
VAVSVDQGSLDLFAHESDEAAEDELGRPQAVEPQESNAAPAPTEAGAAGAPAPLTAPSPLWVDERATERNVPREEEAAGSTSAGHAAVADEVRLGSGARSEGPRVFTVSEVNRGVRTLLEGTFPGIWVEGEIGRWTRHGSGHCYFTLKDERSQLRCVMFQSDAARLPMDPEEGMRIRAFGSLTLYEARGEYQLAARRVETASGEGLWRLAFERLRSKLLSEGLLAPERKRPIPEFPAAVGVVTSLSGAALRDIVTVIGRRAPWVRVVVRGARVQGEGAAGELAAAVDALGRSGLVEVLIVGRGGGSMEDLWAFNEEVLARALAACPVPVISAVGHEVDVTIADLVADARAATPSAAAETAVPDGAELARGLTAARRRLARGLESSVAERKRTVRRQAVHLARAARRQLEPRRRAAQEARRRMGRALARAVAPRRLRAGALRDRLLRAMRLLVGKSRRHLLAVTGTMEALSPLATLRRGYAVPVDDAGRVLRDVDAFEPGRRFTLRVVDGRVVCEAIESERTENGSERTDS